MRTPGRQRHAAGQENLDAVLDRDVGKRRPVAFDDHDVAQIEVISRHVDRQQRLRAAAAIDGELARLESRARSRAADPRSSPPA